MTATERSPGKQIIGSGAAIKLTWLLIVYWFLKGIFWIVICPPWQAPDEPTHFAYAYRLSGLQPTERAHLERAILGSMGDFKFWKLNKLPEPNPPPEAFYSSPLLSIRPTQANQPQLFYLPAAQLLQAFPTWPLHQKLLLLRLYSLIIGLLTMILIASALRVALADHPELVPFALAFACFQPQVSFIFASFNNDVLLNMTAAAFFVFLFRWLKVRGALSDFIMILICFMIGIQVKRSALLLIVPMLMSLPKLRRVLFAGRNRISLMVMLIWSLVAVWSLGCWFAPSAVRQIAVRLTEQLAILQIRPPTSLSSIDWRLFLTFLIKSYLYNVGWLIHPAPSSFYMAWVIIYAVAGCGLVAAAPRFRSDSHAALGILGVSIAAIITVAGAIVMVYGINQALSQGRYFFPALTPMVLLLGVGLNGYPAVVRRFLLPTCCLMLLALDLGSLFGVTILEFYF